MVANNRFNNNISRFTLCMNLSLDHRMYASINIDTKQQQPFSFSWFKETFTYACREKERETERGRERLVGHLIKSAWTNVNFQSSIDVDPLKWIYAFNTFLADTWISFVYNSRKVPRFLILTSRFRSMQYKYSVPFCFVRQFILWVVIFWCVVYYLGVSSLCAVSFRKVVDHGSPQQPVLRSS